MMFQAKGMADCSFRAQGAPGTLQAGLVCKGFSSRIGFDRTDADHFSINTLIKDERSIGGVKQDPIALKTSYDWIKSDCGNVAAFSSTPWRSQRIIFRPARSRNFAPAICMSAAMAWRGIMRRRCSII